jgi:AAA family ATPase
VENLSYPTPITPKCLIFPLTSIFTCLLFAGVPDTPARTAILRVLLSKTPHTLNAEDMLAVASRAHGYAGTDLGAVVREAGTAVIKRWTSRSSTTGSATTTNVDEVSREHDHQDEQPPALTVSDLLAALPLVRPSALRTFLGSGGAGTPVRYADIGGLGATIQKLQECVEWPLRHPGTYILPSVLAVREYADESRNLLLL